MSLGVVVVLGLASARLWRLIAVDDVTAPIRRRLLSDREFQLGSTIVKKRGRPLWSAWLECPWCSGLWIAAGAVALYRYAPDDVVLWVVGVLAVSEAVGLVVRNLDPTED